MQDSFCYTHLFLSFNSVWGLEKNQSGGPDPPPPFTNLCSSYFDNKALNIALIFFYLLKEMICYFVSLWLTAHL